MFAGRLCLKREKFFWAVVLAIVLLNGLQLKAARSQGKNPIAGTKIRLATPTASLSYLPIHVALLGSTDGLKGDLPAAAIFDFSPAAEAAKEWAARK